MFPLFPRHQEKSCKNNMLRSIFDEISNHAVWKSKETCLFYVILCNPKESMNVLIRNFLVHGCASTVLEPNPFVTSSGKANFIQLTSV